MSLANFSLKPVLKATAKKKWLSLGLFSDAETSTGMMPE
jgi:hypothetical protein